MAIFEYFLRPIRRSRRSSSKTAVTQSLLFTLELPLELQGRPFFLLKGTKHGNTFNDEYLLRYGMATGSTILMTESAYMTDAAWLEASKSIVEGYCQLPFMKENENWFIAKLLDGFKSHENDL
jgi:hypothetical protein